MLKGLCRSAIAVLLCVAPAHAAEVPGTGYTPSEAIAAAVRREMAVRLGTADAGLAARLQAAEAREDLRATWAKTVAADGLRPNDVADAVTARWVLAWLVVHRRADNSRAQVQGVRRQVAAGLLANAAFRSMDDAGRQRMAELQVYDFVLVFAAYADATRRHDDAALTTLANTEQAAMQARAKLDMRRLSLTDDGFRPEAAPAPARPAAPIDRVLVAHFFGLGPTGLVNTFDTYALFRDGTVFHNPASPPAELDTAAEPAHWGRWAADGGTLVLTWPTRNPGNQVERRPLADLVACHPAEPGTNLEERFTRTGGGGPVIPGGIVTLSEAELNLHRDGSFDTASATAVSGAGIGGGSSRPRQGGRYRLDGYALVLERPGAESEHRFFCRYGDDDGVVFIGPGAWLRSR